VVAEAERRERAVDALDVLGRAGVGDVEDAELVTPVPPGLGLPDEPVRMLDREPASSRREERRGPDSGEPAGRSDPVGGARERAKARRALEPVADAALVAVVDLDDLDRELETLDRGERGGDVGLGHLVPVAVPRAPARGDRSDASRSDFRCPRGERGDQVVGRRLLDHRPVGRDEDAIRVGEGSDRRHRAGRVRGRPEPDRALLRYDREQPFPLEAGRRRGRARPERHRLPLAITRPRRGRRRRIQPCRAPRLPAVLVDMRLRRVGPHLGDGRERGLGQVLTEPARRPWTK